MAPGEQCASARYVSGTMRALQWASTEAYRGRLDEYLMHSNEAVKYKLHTKHTV